MGRIFILIAYLLLAIIQGFAEILPISSSGYLLMLKKIFGFDLNNLMLELVLHFASLVALFIFYRKLIFKIIKGVYLYLFKKDRENLKYYRMFIFIVLAIIPSAVAGYFLDDYFEYLVSSTLLIGIFFIINGINLYSLKNVEGDKKVEGTTFKDILIVGFHQVIGLIPGISRSGSALSGCYRTGIDKKESSEIVFLMLFPLVIGSIILNIGDFYVDELTLIPLIISFVVCAFLTYLSLKIFIKLISNKKIYYFSYYCFLLGTTLIILSM